MKYLAILFSLYLVALTLVPCTDVAEGQIIEHSSYSAKISVGGLEHCDQEGCAPFCSCNCCSIGKHFPNQTIISLTEPIHQVTYPICINSAVKNQPVSYLATAKIRVAFLFFLPTLMGIIMLLG